MNVPVVGVGEMGVRMLHRFMAVTMAMHCPVPQRQSWLIRVAVLMVNIMLVWMFVLHHLVNVDMFMSLGQVQPDPQAHQQPGRNQP